MDNKELEIEHFGFTSEQSSLERKYFMQKILRNALDAMVNKFDVSPETLELLKKAKEEVFENIWSSMSEEIEMANNLDKQYFTIPDHVLLAPYFDHIKTYTEEHEQEIDKQLCTFKKNFLENSVMLASLNLENSQCKAFSSFVQTEVDIQKLLMESINSINKNKIYEFVDKMKQLKLNEK
ncbi:mis12 isoform 1-T3 [Cochliomyia hominivorax]